MTNVLRALSVCEDLQTIVREISKDSTINEFTRKELSNNTHDLMLYIHAAIKEKYGYSE